MAGIVASLSIFGYIFLIRRLLRWPIEAIPFFVVSLIIVITYIAALFGLLQPVTTLLIVFGSIALLATPFYLPHNRQQLFKEYLTPGLGIFIFFLIVFGIMAQTIVVLHDWDTLIRYLPYAKLTYYHHALLRPGYVPDDISYPPAGSLLYYYMMRFSHYSEGIICYAQLFLLLPPLTILLRKYTWSNWSSAFIVFCIFLLILIFGFRLDIGPDGTIYMDQAVGLFFGGMLASYFMMPEEKRLWLYLLIPAMAFILLKPLVFPFILVTTVIILCDQYLLKKGGKKSRLSLLLFTGMLILPVLISDSWNAYLKHVNVVQYWTAKLVIHHVANGITALSPDQFYTVLMDYIYALHEPLLFMLAMLIIVMFVCKFVTSQEKKRLTLMHFWLASGLIAYFSLLIFLYLYLLSPHLALMMNSFNRFMMIYYYGWMFLLFTQILYLRWNEKQPAWLRKISASLPTLTNPQKSRIVYGIVVFIVVYTGFYALGHHIQFENETHGEYTRFAMKEVAQPVNDLTSKDARIEIIWMSQYNLKPSIIGYELIPRFANPTTGVFSGPEDFKNQVQQYDYVLIGRATPAFWRDYKKYFASEEKTPVTKISYCVRIKNLNQISPTNPNLRKKQKCVIEQIPIYLYKVTKQNGKLMLRNVLADTNVT